MPLLPSHTKKAGQAWLLVSPSAVSIFFVMLVLAWKSF